MLDDPAAVPEPFSISHVVDGDVSQAHDPSLIQHGEGHDQPSAYDTGAPESDLTHITHITHIDTATETASITGEDISPTASAGLGTHFIADAPAEGIGLDNVAESEFGAGHTTFGTATTSAGDAGTARPIVWPLTIPTANQPANGLGSTSGSHPTNSGNSLPAPLAAPLLWATSRREPDINDVPFENTVSAIIPSPRQGMSVLAGTTAVTGITKLMHDVNGWMDRDIAAAQQKYQERFQTRAADADERAADDADTKLGSPLEQALGRSLADQPPKIRAALGILAQALHAGTLTPEHIQQLLKLGRNQRRAGPAGVLAKFAKDHNLPWSPRARGELLTALRQLALGDGAVNGGRVPSATSSSGAHGHQHSSQERRKGRSGTSPASRSPGTKGNPKQSAQNNRGTPPGGTRTPPNGTGANAHTTVGGRVLKKLTSAVRRIRAAAQGWNARGPPPEGASTSQRTDTGVVGAANSTSPSSSRVASHRGRIVAQLGIVAALSAAAAALAGKLVTSASTVPTGEVQSVGGWNMGLLSWGLWGAVTGVGLAVIAKSVIKGRTEQRTASSERLNALAAVAKGAPATLKRQPLLALATVLIHISTLPKSARGPPFTARDVADGFHGQLDASAPTWIRNRATRLRKLHERNPQRTTDMLAQLADPLVGVLRKDGNGYRVADNLVTMVTALDDHGVPLRAALLRNPLAVAPLAQDLTVSGPVSVEVGESVRRAIREARFDFGPVEGKFRSRLPRRKQGDFPGALRKIHEYRKAETAGRKTTAGSKLQQITEQHHVHKAEKKEKRARRRYGANSQQAQDAARDVARAKARLAEAGAKLAEDDKALKALTLLKGALIQNARDAGAGAGLSRDRVDRKIDWAVLGWAMVLRDIAKVLQDRLGGGNLAGLTTSATDNLKGQLPGTSSDQIGMWGTEAEGVAAGSLGVVSVVGSRWARNMIATAVIAGAVVASMITIGLLPSKVMASLFPELTASLFAALGASQAIQPLTLQRLHAYFEVSPEFRVRRQSRLGTVNKLISSLVPSATMAALINEGLSTTFLGAGALFAASTLAAVIALRGGYDIPEDQNYRPFGQEIRDVITTGWRLAMGSPRGLRRVLFSMPTLAFLMMLPSGMYVGVSSRLMHLDSPGWTAATFGTVLVIYPLARNGLGILAGMQWPLLQAKLSKVGTDKDGNPINSAAKTLTRASLLQLVPLAFLPLLWSDPNFVNLALIVLVHGIIDSWALHPMMFGWPDRDASRYARIGAMEMAGMAAGEWLGRVQFNNADKAAKAAPDLTHLLTTIHQGNWNATALSIPLAAAFTVVTYLMVHHHQAYLAELDNALKRTGASEATRKTILEVLRANRIATVGGLRDILDKQFRGNGYRAGLHAELRKNLAKLEPHRDALNNAFAYLDNRGKRNLANFDAHAGGVTAVGLPDALRRALGKGQRTLSAFMHSPNETERKLLDLALSKLLPRGPPPGVLIQVLDTEAAAKAKGIKGTNLGDAVIHVLGYGWPDLTQSGAGTVVIAQDVLHRLNQAVDAGEISTGEATALLAELIDHETTFHIGGHDTRAGRDHDDDAEELASGYFRLTGVLDPRKASPDSANQQSTPVGAPQPGAGTRVNTRQGAQRVGAAVGSHVAGRVAAKAGLTGAGAAVGSQVLAVLGGLILGPPGAAAGFYAGSVLGPLVAGRVAAEAGTEAGGWLATTLAAEWKAEIARRKAELAARKSSGDPSDTGDGFVGGAVARVPGVVDDVEARRLVREGEERPSPASVVWTARLRAVGLLGHNEEVVLLGKHDNLISYTVYNPDTKKTVVGLFGLPLGQDELSDLGQYGLLADIIQHERGHAPDAAGIVAWGKHSEPEHEQERKSLVARVDRATGSHRTAQGQPSSSSTEQRLSGDRGLVVQQHLRVVVQPYGQSYLSISKLVSALRRALPDIYGKTVMTRRQVWELLAKGLPDIEQTTYEWLKTQPDPVFVREHRTLLGDHVRVMLGGKIGNIVLGLSGTFFGKEWQGKYGDWPYGSLPDARKAAIHDPNTHLHVVLNPVDGDTGEDRLHSAYRNVQQGTASVADHQIYLAIQELRSGRPWNTVTFYQGNRPLIFSSRPDITTPHVTTSTTTNTRGTGMLSSPLAAVFGIAVVGVLAAQVGGMAGLAAAGAAAGILVAVPALIAAAVRGIRAAAQAWNARGPPHQRATTTHHTTTNRFGRVTRATSGAIGPFGATTKAAVPGMVSGRTASGTSPPGSGRLALAASAVVEALGTVGLVVLAHITGNPAVSADMDDNVSDVAAKLAGLFSLGRGETAERIAGYLVVGTMLTSAAFAARATVAGFVHTVRSLMDLSPGSPGLAHPGIVLIAAGISVAINLLSSGILSRAAKAYKNDLLKIMAVDARTDVKAGFAVFGTAIFAEVATKLGLAGWPAEVVSAVTAAWITWQIATGAWEAFTDTDPKAVAAIQGLLSHTAPLERVARVAARIAGWLRAGGLRTIAGRVADRLQALVPLQRRGQAGLAGGFTGSATDRDRALRIVLADLVQRGGRHQKAFQAILDRLNDPHAAPAMLLALDPSGRGQAIIAIGNPDTASHISVYVPGLAHNLGTIDWGIRHADALHQSAARAGAPDNAVIVWFGYGMPQFTVAAALPYAARAGAPRLDNFLTWLRDTHQGTPARTTVIAHSYAALLATMTDPQRLGLLVDDLIFVGGVPVPAKHVSQLGLPEGHVWATATNWDVVAHLPWWGRVLPTAPSFGANVFDSGTGGQGTYRPSKGTVARSWYNFYSYRYNDRVVVPHGVYFDPYSLGLSNIAKIISGRGHQVTRAPGGPRTRIHTTTGASSVVPAALSTSPVAAPRRGLAGRIAGWALARAPPGVLRVVGSALVVARLAATGLDWLRAGGLGAMAGRVADQLRALVPLRLRGQAGWQVAEQLRGHVRQVRVARQALDQVARDGAATTSEAQRRLDEAVAAGLDFATTAGVPAAYAQRVLDRAELGLRTSLQGGVAGFYATAGGTVIGLAGLFAPQISASFGVGVGQVLGLSVLAVWVGTGTRVVYSVFGERVGLKTIVLMPVMAGLALAGVGQATSFAMVPWLFAALGLYDSTSGLALDRLRWHPLPSVKAEDSRLGRSQYMGNIAGLVIPLVFWAAGEAFGGMQGAFITTGMMQIAVAALTGWVLAGGVRPADVPSPAHGLGGKLHTIEDTIVDTGRAIVRTEQRALSSPANLGRFVFSPMVLKFVDNVPSAIVLGLTGVLVSAHLPGLAVAALGAQIAIKLLIAAIMRGRDSLFTHLGGGNPIRLLVATHLTELAVVLPAIALLATHGTIGQVASLIALLAVMDIASQLTHGALIPYVSGPATITRFLAVGLAGISLASMVGITIAAGLSTALGQHDSPGQLAPILHSTELHLVMAYLAVAAAAVPLALLTGRFTQDNLAALGKQLTKQDTDRGPKILGALIESGSRNLGAVRALTDTELAEILPEATDRALLDEALAVLGTPREEASPAPVIDPFYGSGVGPTNYTGPIDPLYGPEVEHTEPSTDSTDAPVPSGSQVTATRTTNDNDTGDNGTRGPGMLSSPWAWGVGVAKAVGSAVVRSIRAAAKAWKARGPPRERITTTHHTRGRTGTPADPAYGSDVDPLVAGDTVGALPGNYLYVEALRQQFMQRRGLLAGVGRLVRRFAAASGRVPGARNYRWRTGGSLSHRLSYLVTATFVSGVTFEGIYGMAALASWPEARFGLPADTLFIAALAGAAAGVALLKPLGDVFSHRGLTVGSLVGLAGAWEGFGALADSAGTFQASAVAVGFFASTLWGLLAHVDEWASAKRVRFDAAVIGAFMLSGDMTVLPTLRALQVWASTSSQAAAHAVAAAPTPAAAHTLIDTSMRVAGMGLAHAGLAGMFAALMAAAGVLFTMPTEMRVRPPLRTLLWGPVAGLRTTVGRLVALSYGLTAITIAAFDGLWLRAIAELGAPLWMQSLIGYGFLAGGLGLVGLAGKSIIASIRNPHADPVDSFVEKNPGRAMLTMASLLAVGGMTVMVTARLPNVQLFGLSLTVWGVAATLILGEFGSTGMISAVQVALRKLISDPRRRAQAGNSAVFSKSGLYLAGALLAAPVWAGNTPLGAQWPAVSLLVAGAGSATLGVVTYFWMHEVRDPRTAWGKARKAQRQARQALLDNVTNAKETLGERTRDLRHAERDQTHWDHLVGATAAWAAQQGLAERAIRAALGMPVTEPITGYSPRGPPGRQPGESVQDTLNRLGPHLATFRQQAREHVNTAHAAVTQARHGLVTARAARSTTRQNRRTSASNGTGSAMLSSPLALGAGLAAMGMLAVHLSGATGLAAMAGAPALIAIGAVATAALGGYGLLKFLRRDRGPPFTAATGMLIGAATVVALVITAVATHHGLFSLGGASSGAMMVFGSGGGRLNRLFGQLRGPLPGGLRKPHGPAMNERLLIHKLRGVPLSPQQEAQWLAELAQNGQLPAGELAGWVRLVVRGSHDALADRVDNSRALRRLGFNPAEGNPFPKVEFFWLTTPAENRSTGLAATAGYRLSSNGVIQVFARDSAGLVYALTLAVFAPAAGLGPSQTVWHMAARAAERGVAGQALDPRSWLPRRVANELSQMAEFPWLRGRQKLVNEYEQVQVNNNVLLGETSSWRAPHRLIAALREANRQYTEDFHRYALVGPVTQPVRRNHVGLTDLEKAAVVAGLADIVTARGDFRPDPAYRWNHTRVFQVSHGINGFAPLPLTEAANLHTEELGIPPFDDLVMVSADDGRVIDSLVVDGVEKYAEATNEQAKKIGFLADLAVPAEGLLLPEEPQQPLPALTPTPTIAWLKSLGASPSEEDEKAETKLSWLHNLSVDFMQLPLPPSPQVLSAGRKLPWLDIRGNPAFPASFWMLTVDPATTSAGWMAARHDKPSGDKQLMLQLDGIEGFGSVAIDETSGPAHKFETRGGRLARAVYGLRLSARGWLDSTGEGVFALIRDALRHGERTLLLHSDYLQLHRIALPA
ncbi:MAG: alpha/beta hydrolase, partial [Pseudonocardiaceae bacterium]